MFPVKGEKEIVQVTSNWDSIKPWSSLMFFYSCDWIILFSILYFTNMNIWLAWSYEVLRISTERLSKLSVRVGKLEQHHSRSNSATFVGISIHKIICRKIAHQCWKMIGLNVLFLKLFAAKWNHSHSCQLMIKCRT